MTSATRTHRDIIRFLNAAQVWQQQNPEDSKLKYAISRVMKSARKANEDYDEKLTEINVEHCSCDEKGNILTDARGGFIFAKPELNKRNHDNRVLLDAEVSIDVYIATTVPADLNPQLEEAFAGFVIPEPTEPEAEAE